MAAGNVSSLDCKIVFLGRWVCGHFEYCVFACAQLGVRVIFPLLSNKQTHFDTVSVDTHAGRPHCAGGMV